jgi:hypothetical protein
MLEGLVAVVVAQVTGEAMAVADCLAEAEAAQPVTDPTIKEEPEGGVLWLYRTLEQKLPMPL